MTGETDLDDVRWATEQLEAVPDEREHPIHMVIATSMISHGVDIDRFNFIAFHGMPRQTAEYIQSYSRVGRENPGSVFALYHPMQVRDQSYYQQFHHYHEYEDLLVEATPLERWAEFAIEQTLAGIVCGALFQYYDFKYEEEIDGRLYRWDGLEDALREGIFDGDGTELREFVREAYGVAESEGDSTDGAALYSKRVDDLFENIWATLMKSDPDNDKEYLPNLLENPPEEDDDAVEDAVEGEYSHDGVRTPMTNLRDIDEQIPIEPTGDTGTVVNLFSQR
jgi:hypothetical protein